MFILSAGSGQYGSFPSTMVYDTTPALLKLMIIAAIFTAAKRV